MSIVKTLSTDVLIIGGGITGHVAAWELTQRGINNIIVRTGTGASPGIAGFNVPCADPADSVEQFIADTKASGHGRGGEALTRELCEGAKDLPDYLARIGFTFDRNEDGSLFARKSLGSSYGRVVGFKNFSGGLALKLLEEHLITSLQTRTIEGVRAVRLIRDGDAVCGACVYSAEHGGFVNIYSRAVLLCSGGFAGIFPFTSNPGDISGDGAAMALLAGAGLIDMEFVQFEPSSAVWPPQIRGKGVITTLLYEGAVIKNALGERFMFRYDPNGERVNKDVLSHAIEHEIREGRGTEHGGVWFDASGVGAERLNEAYEPFVRRYAAVGIDFTKEPVELANAAHTTIGGVEIDPGCRSAVRGLYVAGEAAGHVHGSNRIGGSAGSETLVFGQIAARSIIEDLPGLCPGKPAFEPAFGGGPAVSPERLGAIAEREKAIVGECAGVFRDGNTLARGYGELQALLAELLGYGSSGDAAADCALLRRINDTYTAMALLYSAWARCDSCGSHQRSDFPGEAAGPYHTLIKLADGGAISAFKIPE